MTRRYWQVSIRKYTTFSDINDNDLPEILQIARNSCEAGVSQPAWAAVATRLSECKVKK